MGNSPRCERVSCWRAPLPSMLLLLSSSPASGRPALHEGLFYISVPRWIFLLTFFPGFPFYGIKLIYSRLLWSSNGTITSASFGADELLRRRNILLAWVSTFHEFCRI
jgi:hypothetical protein